MANHKNTGAQKKLRKDMAPHNNVGGFNGTGQNVMHQQHLDRGQNNL